jgi:hypothetical protein
MEPQSSKAETVEQYALSRLLALAQAVITGAGPTARLESESRKFKSSETRPNWEAVRQFVQAFET